MSILLKILGDYCIGEPPLSIPNREVKPICADGTAFSGRVGRRLSYLNPARIFEWDFLFYPIPGFVAQLSEKGFSRGALFPS
jgi:hypothetical protein